MPLRRKGPYMRKLVISFCLLIAACGYYQDVEYEFVDGTIRCYGYDDRYLYESDGYVSLTCVWFCHNYEGHKGAYVQLDFVSVGDGFYLDSEFIDDDGICD